MHGRVPILVTPRTDTSSRFIATSPESPPASLVDVDALAVWFARRDVGVVRTIRLPSGGSYRMVVRYDDSTNARGKATTDSDVIETRVIAMVPGVRVVLAVDFVSDDPGHAGTMSMTWAITRVEVTAENVPDGVSAEDQAVGLNSSRAKLARYLEG